MLKINKPTFKDVKKSNIGKYIKLENGDVNYKIIGISENNNYIVELIYNKGIAKTELPIQVYDYITIM